EVIMTVEQQLIEKGRKEGREEGERKGREEGERKGREEGERKKAIETAKKMKNDNVEINIIMKYTGLSKKEIENL
ncbi:MAG: hypothetical protein ACOCV8_00655, partial [Spirochaetota bacterium]